MLSAFPFHFHSKKAPAILDKPPTDLLLNQIVLIKGQGVRPSESDGQRARGGPFCPLLKSMQASFIPFSPPAHFVFLPSSTPAFIINLHLLFLVPMWQRGGQELAGKGEEG